MLSKVNECNRISIQTTAAYQNTSDLLQIHRPPLYIVFLRSPQTACTKHKLNDFPHRTFYIPSPLSEPKLRGLSQLLPHDLPQSIRPNHFNPAIYPSLSTSFATDKIQPESPPTQTADRPLSTAPDSRITPM